jgi:hypothetical protein
MTHDIGVLMPAGEHLHNMAASFARPVARGWMSLVQADAGLIAATVRAKRESRLGPREPADVVDGLRHTLRMMLEGERYRRGMTEHRICRVLKPLIGIRKSWGRLMSEAHGVNGQDGFPLTEEEVNDVVRTEVWFALPPAPRGGRRHG